MTNKTETEIDSILTNLFQILPVFHKKLLRMDLGGVTGDLTRLHLAVMSKLGGGSMTVSELANTSVIPRPQMTHIIEQLVRSSIVERHPDGTDRRVINVALTEHGHVLLKELKQKVKENIKQSLAGLTPEELAEMSQAMETLRRIGARL